MRIENEELAPKELVQLILHYTHKEGLYDKEIKRILFVDDPKFPDGIYNADKQTLVLNFGTMHQMIPAYGLDMLNRIGATWAVQFCVALSKIRAAIQHKQGMDNEMAKPARVKDAYEWTYIEMLRLVGLDNDLYMPDTMDDMGIMGHRLRIVLSNEYQKGGARIDAVGLTVKGAVEFNRLWKFMTHAAMKHMKEMVEEHELGRKNGFYNFLSFYEWYVYCNDHINIQKAAKSAANRRLSEYVHEQLANSKEREVEVVESGELKEEVAGDSTTTGG